jgi:ribosomal peptide maturation radical SAM protein 1
MSWRRRCARFPTGDDPQPAARSGGGVVRVAIVSMPFAAIRPAMGGSLLVAHLHRMGVEAKVFYLSMAMHQRIGREAYDYIADRAPTQCLAGDWVFAEALSGPRPEADARYADLFRSRFSALGESHALQYLDHARASVESYLDQCLSDVDWGAWDVVGLTSSFAQHVASLALARRIKQAHPGVTIVFGGANCEDQMGLALHRNFAFVDFVCSGEADLSFPELVGRLAAGTDPADVPGVISRRGAQSQFTTLVPRRVADLDELPHPDFHDYVEQRTRHFPSLREQPIGLLMETSRGCWWGEKHHCTFCGLNGKSMTYRSKSAGRVLQELSELASQYNAAHVEMVDNILDMDYFRDVLPRVAVMGLKVELFYETKANLTKEQLRVLRAAGVTSIQPGVESFSTPVLKLMRKGTTAVQNIQLLKWCAELGIAAYWNLLYGFPGERPEEYRQMADLMDALTHLEPPTGMGRVRLDRFSPHFDQAERFGFRDVRPDRSYAAIYDLPAEELHDLAYYFEYDEPEHAPRGYARDAQRAVQHWKRTYAKQSLVCVDHTDRLAVWDFRLGAGRLLTLLEGWQRLVYLHCDQHRSRRNVEEFATAAGCLAGELDAFLDELIALRLLVAVDGRYIGLAVSVAEKAPVAPEPAFAF